MTRVGATAVIVVLLGLICWVVLTYSRSSRVQASWWAYLCIVVLLTVAPIVWAGFRPPPIKRAAAEPTDGRRSKPRTGLVSLLASRGLTDFLIWVLGVAFLGYLAHSWYQQSRHGAADVPDPWLVMIAFVTLMLLGAYRSAVSD